MHGCRHGHKDKARMCLNRPLVSGRILPQDRSQGLEHFQYMAQGAQHTAILSPRYIGALLVVDRIESLLDGDT
eukprot:13099456-Alexandrium_andersonii.AAC.1